MIELVYSNKTERLLDQLSDNLQEQRRDGAHPLDPVQLVVPNRNLQSWLLLGLSQIQGVAANLKFSSLDRFFGDLVFRATGGTVKLIDLHLVEAAVLALLQDDRLLEQPELKPVKRYLESSKTGIESLPNYRFDAYLAGDGADLRRVQLARRVATLFWEYSLTRPEMIDLWQDNGTHTEPEELFGQTFKEAVLIDRSLVETAKWQRFLWRVIFSPEGIFKQHQSQHGHRWVTIDHLISDEQIFQQIKESGFSSVHIFAVSGMARRFHQLLERLGQIGTVKIYSLNPCIEFGETAGMPTELNPDSRQLVGGFSETSKEDPYGLLKAEIPALCYWGRPGRENLHILGELTNCSFNSLFDDPPETGGGLLQQLQNDIMKRKAGLKPDSAVADETIKLVGAPTARREVEWVADEIWRLLREDKGDNDQPPLRFSDIAVVVNAAGSELYLPQIESVFAACQNLPNNLFSTSGSRMLEALVLLLKLPFGRFSRTEMLTFLSHPAVIGCLDGLSADDLATVAENLGIVYGADHFDHDGTYIDEDVYNWDQGIKRLALGAFMTGEKSGDERIFETTAGRWLAEEVSGSAFMSIGLFIRSLLADAHFVREQQLTLSDWADFYRKQLETYFCLETAVDQQDRLRLLQALNKLEAMDLGRLVSGRTAAELALRTVESLSGSYGGYPAEGVVVSSYLPLRAIPFRVVFLLGLGEGLFPAAGHRDALDLRTVHRQAGDVDPSERDRYLFLETLLSTRERLYLSYVCRDELTGDTLQPSAVVQELLYLLEQDYLGADGMEALRIKPALRRYADSTVGEDTFFDEARREVRVQEIAGRWRSGGGDVAGSEGIKTLLETVHPENRAALTQLLGLPGEPPVAAATPRVALPGRETAVEAPVVISLAALRRFLECPMQGWAATLLGLTALEEDPAEQEEEDFTVSRLVETSLLNDLFYDAAVSGVDPQELYRERVTRLRLAGQFPVGILGRVAGKRHFSIIEGWQSLLAGLQSSGVVEPGKAGNALLLQRFSLGKSYRRSTACSALDPLTLNISLPEAEHESRIVPVQVTGVTDGFLDNGRLVLVLQSRRPPEKKGKAIFAQNFRYILRGAVSQAALVAAGSAEGGERQILICYADSAENTGIMRVRLHQTDREQAVKWLTALVEDLIGSAHGYLLPCEAVYEEYHERQNSQIDARSLSSLVKEMAADEWSRFSSLWGPVPIPRQYEPPEENSLIEIVNRRFEPLFRDIIDLEVLP